jgi:Divergent InlB B-repeat domain
MPRLTHVVVLATLAATGLFGPTALAQPAGSTQVAPPATVPLELQASTWVGSASCTVTGMNSKNDPSYSGTETHKWEIIPWVIYTNSDNSIVYYAEQWTAVGGGGDSKESWSVNAKGPVPGYLQFWLPPGSSLLNIKRWSSQLEDHTGATVTNKSTLAKSTSPVWELNNFPTSVATLNVPNVVEGSSSFMLPGNFLVKEPNDAENQWDCSWDFEYRLAPKTRLPGFKPDKIGDKTATPLPEGKPPLGSIVPATFSVFFGGPGNGSVTASPGSISSGGATITLTATPDATSVFAGWGGSCSGTGPTCSVLLGASNRVIAYFRSKFKTVATGAYHSCALRPAGVVHLCYYKPPARS